MFSYLCEWMKNLAFYMILVTAVLQVLPNSDYKKYIRFFTGLILILLVLTPVLRLLDSEEQIAIWFKEGIYEETKKEIEEMEEIAIGR